MTKARAFSLIPLFLFLISFTQQIPRFRASLRFNSLGSFKPKTNTKSLNLWVSFLIQKTNHETPLITTPTSCNSTNKNTTNIPHGIWVKLLHKWIHVENTKLQTSCTKTTSLAQTNSKKQFTTLLGIQNMIHIQQHKNPSPKNTRQNLINLQNYLHLT